MANISIIRTFRKFWRREITRIATLMFLVIVLAGSLYTIFEKGIRSFFESFYFAVITITTTGYGDITPKTIPGRLITVFLIFSGTILISSFTATISSIIISKKLKDGQGVNRIKEKKHVIICGWNRNVETVIRSLSDTGVRDIVLVNDADPAQINPVTEKFPGTEIKFVKGDFADINILNRANIGQSRGVIMVPDIASSSSQGADEKTVFATMTIKSVSEKIKVYVQLLREETIPYIERAKADEYFIAENIAPYFLTTNISNPGISEVMLNLMSPDNDNALVSAHIPAEFAGKTFGELSEYFRKKENSILIALVQFQDVLEMKNINSKDTASIDAFIKRKFEEAGRLTRDLDKKKVILNPDDDYIIKSFETAVLIRRSKKQ